MEQPLDQSEASYEVEYSLGIFRDAANDPLSQLEAASFGDTDAHRALAAAAFVTAEDAPNAHVIITEGLVFARLAAVEGRADDIFQLVAMLQRSAQLWGQNSEWELLGEAIAWIQFLAEQGNEVAATALNRMADAATTEMMEFARGFGARLAKQIGGN